MPHDAWPPLPNGYLPEDNPGFSEEDKVTNHRLNEIRRRLETITAEIDRVVYDTLAQQDERFKNEVNALLAEQERIYEEAFERLRASWLTPSS